MVSQLPVFMHQASNLLIWDPIGPPLERARLSVFSRHGAAREGGGGMVRGD